MKKKVLLTAFGLVYAIGCAFGFAACKKTKPAESSNGHNWATAWSQNETHHWHACRDEGCTEKNDYAKHDFTNGDCVCGKQKNETPAHKHQWASAWERNKTHHWHACLDTTCKETNDYGKHDYTNGDCVCGAKAPLPATEGIEYVLTEDGKSYSVAGIGEATASEIVIASEYEGKPVTNINDNAFQGCEITSVVVQSNVTDIGQYAFYACNDLETVTLGDDVEVLKKGAFYQCGKLANVVISDSVKDIGEYAFYACNALESITLGNGVEVLEKGAFYQCENLTGIAIPDSVKTIGTYAFYGCNALETVSLGNGVTNVGTYAFYECGNLTTANLGNSVKVLEQGAFRDCKRLTNVVIPDSTTEIAGGVFYDCTGLNTITIGKNVTTMGQYAFMGAKLSTIYYTGNLREWCDIDFGDKGDSYLMDLHATLYVDGKKIEGELVIPEGTTKIPDYAFNRQAITSVKIPSSVTYIGMRTFYKCALTSVVIPDTVTEIAAFAFSSCGELENVTIGKGITELKSMVFAYCSKLSEVTYNGTSAQWAAITKDDYWDYQTGTYTMKYAEQA